MQFYTRQQFNAMPVQCGMDAWNNWAILYQAFSNIAVQWVGIGYIGTGLWCDVSTNIGKLHLTF